MDRISDGWMNALDEMRRSDWQQVWLETSRDIAAGRGRSLDEVAKELGLDGPARGRRRARRRYRTSDDQ